MATRSTLVVAVRQNVRWRMLRLAACSGRAEDVFPPFFSNHHHNSTMMKSLMFIAYCILHLEPLRRRSSYF